MYVCVCFHCTHIHIWADILISIDISDIAESFILILIIYFYCLLSFMWFDQSKIAMVFEWFFFCYFIFFTFFLTKCCQTTWMYKKSSNSLSNKNNCGLQFSVQQHWTNKIVLFSLFLILLIVQKLFCEAGYHNWNSSSCLW